MRMKFKVVVETDAAEPEEIREALRDTLQALDMPNGDTLFIQFPQVEFIGEKS